MKKTSLQARIRRIRLVAFDVDGVLTDGSILLSGGGAEIKVFHAHDGAGIKYLERAGIRTAILSGRRSQAVSRRARELGIRYLLQGFKVKLKGLEKLVRQTKTGLEEICFVGDDLPDIPVMQAVGLAACVADARPEVRRVAHIVTHARGGHGAVRELAEQILKVQARWGGIVARYGLNARGSIAGGES